MRQSKVEQIVSPSVGVHNSFFILSETKSYKGEEYPKKVTGLDKGVKIAVSRTKSLELGQA